MSLRFTVLGSGSAGNASLVECEAVVVLLDMGLGPRQLAGRLRTVGRSWGDIRLALLTHTHTDHWNERTLAYLRRLRIPLYCHADHHDELHRFSPVFRQLGGDGLVCRYEANTEIALGPQLHCRALPLSHDSGATFGFRFEGPAGPDGIRPALGYAADLGSWTGDLAQALADVDLLAIEFNHDVELEYRSGRSAHLIARVLGDQGHLSNVQAASLLRKVLSLSAPGRLQHVVQLHLSRDCNDPTLARADAAAVLEDHGGQIDLHTACQDQPGPIVHVRKHSSHATAPRPAKPPRTAPVGSASQLWLPGLEW